VFQAHQAATNFADAADLLCQEHQRGPCRWARGEPAASWRVPPL